MPHHDLGMAWTDTQLAAEYDRLRPGYPDEAVAFALRGARRVADVGCGSGKLTDSLVARGLDVIGVDPAPGMLAVLRRRLPTIETREGTGEATGLPDASVDAVTVAQAWHWMDPVPTGREFVRILRPGGHVALLYNDRDDSVDWCVRITDIIATVRDDLPDHPIEPPLALVEERSFRWAMPMAPEDVVSLMGTRSYVLLASPDERRRLLDRVRDVLATHPDTRGRDTLPMPYVTRVQIAVGV